MIKYIKKEKRQHPRIEEKLPVKIAADGYSFTTTTKNISCVGAYCRVEKYIPPFTKVMVRLTLPITHSNKDNESNIQCNGVVVRSEDEKSGGFNIAIFFNKIQDSQRHKISQYISQFILQNPSSLCKRQWSLR